jgi:hypothetical protein
MGAARQAGRGDGREDRMDERERVRLTRMADCAG